ncbi:type IV pilus assembly protein PilA [Cupriavidus agavae]|uniref:Type IV pilus assembly protein PilA n=2 Tax=Cupriavidus agavae TaxID=1001822 RepID=A0A4Q7S823_9BURK|nr:type IV pilus assembly protein PilA [Cupriavidus agavae]
MIVVAILGILAAIAIPTYQDYTVKAQVARAFWEASAYKIPVEERLHAGVHAFPDPVAALGYIRSPLTATASTFVFNADGSGAIVVTLDGDVHVAARNARITVGRLADGSWNCAVRGGNDGFKPSYLPLACTLDRSA